MEGKKSIAGSLDAPIVVAMSGGVDSSASALLLHEAGYRVIGVSMQVWDYRNNHGNAKKATCCAPSDFDDARTVAQAMGFPFYVFDFEESFDAAVIKPFVQSYLSGYTPNPCLECNRKVKFRELRRRAAGLGCTTVATGHYARIARKADGALALYTGHDSAKDQSYFLYAMNQADLASTVFPVGGMQKEDVRALLGRYGIASAAKEESQDICFVSGETGEFVRKHAETAPQPGLIVDKSGRELGRHTGIHQFTVGQRKGLGLSNPNPLYVLAIHPESQRVLVGEKSELEREEFFIRDAHWISGSIPSSPVRCLVKLRYRHEGVLCEVVPDSPGLARVRFLESWSAVSPGQAAVFYATQECEGAGREVLGGGIIERDSVIAATGHLEEQVGNANRV